MIRVKFKVKQISSMETPVSLLLSLHRSRSTLLHVWQVKQTVVVKYDQLMKTILEMKKGQAHIRSVF